MQDLEKLYKENYQFVFKYLLVLSKDKHLAEDLSQETFLKAIEKIKTFKGECKFSTWLCKIGKNLYLNYLKKHNRIKFLEEEKINNLTITLEELQNDEDNIKLYKEIEKLDNTTKEIMFFRIKENLSIKEIAKILGRTENYVSVIYYRGKEKLKEVYDYEKRK